MHTRETRPMSPPLAAVAAVRVSEVAFVAYCAWCRMHCWLSQWKVCCCIHTRTPLRVAQKAFGGCKWVQPTRSGDAWEIMLWKVSFIVLMLFTLRFNYQALSCMFTPRHCWTLWLGVGLGDWMLCSVMLTCKKNEKKRTCFRIVEMICLYRSMVSNCSDETLS